MQAAVSAPWRFDEVRGHGGAPILPPPGLGGVSRLKAIVAGAVRI